MSPTKLPSSDKIKEILRPTFFGLAEEDLDELARAAVPRDVPSGGVVCREGEPGDAFYVVVSGRVDIVKQLIGEVERHLQALGPGGLFGEIAILQQGTRTATVRASEPTVLLEIGQEAFLRVLGRSPALGIRILVRLTDRLRDADQQSIAALRTTNEELNRTLAKLERLDRTKADFIQVSAHELRTPVTALLGYAQMMGANPAMQQVPEMRMLVEGLVSSTERLNRVFELILDASRVVTDELAIVRSPVSIPLIFAGIQAKYEETLAQRRLTLDLIGLNDLPIYPAAPDMLQKAFHHLINNAMKYTPDGGRITVTGNVVEVPDIGRCVQVSVEDTGIGIAPENLELIFEKFYHTGALSLHSSGTTAYKAGGPGLGLTIAKGVVQAHCGRIWAESRAYDERVCPGSRFVVQLPLSAAITGVPESVYRPDD